MTKTEKTRSLKSEISSPKSALLSILRKMESDGLSREAERLSNIIGRLEYFQNS